MATNENTPKSINGSLGSYRATLVPTKLLGNLKVNRPLPFGSTTGTGFVINTLAASRTEPVDLLIGDEYTRLTESVTYTWLATTNKILDTDGDLATQTGGTAGIWYYYAIIESGAVTIRPSTVAPSYVEGVNEGRIYSHPGTTRDCGDNVYIGWGDCTTATTPLMVEMVKEDYTYYRPSVLVATAGTTFALLDFSASCPLHGVSVSGTIETSAEGTVNVGGRLGSTTTNVILGGLQAHVDNATTTHVSVLFIPFGPTPLNTAGKIYANHVGAAGNIHISQVHDVV